MYCGQKHCLINTKICMHKQNLSYLVETFLFWQIKSRSITLELNSSKQKLDYLLQCQTLCIHLKRFVSVELKLLSRNLRNQETYLRNGDSGKVQNLTWNAFMVSKLVYRNQWFAQAEFKMLIENTRKMYLSANYGD